MRNTFSISLDHGQTPEDLKATVASTPHPLGPFRGMISCGAAASRDFRVFYFSKNPFRFVSEGVRCKDFNGLGLDLPKCPPLVSPIETAILFGSEGVWPNDFNDLGVDLTNSRRCKTACFLHLIPV
jgi:hypothetical protein